MPNDRARRRGLQSLPSGLDETYERIPDRIDSAPSETQQMIGAALKFLALACQPVDITGLTQIIALEAGDSRLDEDKVVDENVILFWCSSLIRRSNFDESLAELAHFTCKSFLMAIDVDKKPSLARFKLTETLDNNYIAKQCLTYVSLADYNSQLIQSLAEANEYITRFPLRRYAVDLWDTHLYDEEDEEIQNLLKRLFAASRPAIFLNWAQERLLGSNFSYGLSSSKNWADVTTLHWAAILALPSLCKWRLSNNADVNSTSELLGTPLHCALRGESLFLGVGFGFLDMISNTRRETERHQAVQTLLAHGADPNLPFRALRDM